MLGCLFEVVETLVLTLVIFFVIQTFVAQPYQVKQQSMEQTLEPEQYVLVDKLTPRFDAYDRGDIVVFNPPPRRGRADGTPFIKRVIAIGGDLVEIRDDGLVYVNGVRLDEPYLFEVDGEPAADRRPARPAALDRPCRRALRDGRPSVELRRLARLRADLRGRRHRPGVAPLLALQRLRRPPDADLSGAGDRRAVNPLLALVAVAVVGGGVVAVSARDARIALLGLVVALIASPLLADPAPGLLPLAARLVAAILAAELLWITLRATSTRTRGSSLGWPVEVLVAVAAFLAGLGMSGIGVETAGPREAQAAGLALAVLALNPVLFARDTFRLGVGVVLLVVSAIVLRVALAGTPARSSR